jgi:very-short-patch-repair endonuclease
MPKKYDRAGYRFGRKRGKGSARSKWKKELATRMRIHKTKPERVLWARLKNGQLGTRFTSQKVILGYIADFWCPSAKLVVEVDGPCHLTRKAYDAHRDMVMKLRKGITTLRFTDQEVYNNLNAVVALILAKLK